MSITLLEGLAAAKPVVATDIKGNREVVTDDVDGLLVAPADSEAMVNAVIKLLDNPERAHALGVQARETIKRKFSQEAMVENTLQLYELDLGDWVPRTDQASRLTAQPESAAGQGL
jgi:glycosyltransferase involved in cell wall biosynthesis